MKQACECRDWSCGLPPCSVCGEDHGGIDMGAAGRFCRDCHLEYMMKRIGESIERDPEAFDRHLENVAKLFGSRKPRTTP